MPGVTGCQPASDANRRFGAGSTRSCRDRGHSVIAHSGGVPEAFATASVLCARAPIFRNTDSTWNFTVCTRCSIGGQWPCWSCLRQAPPALRVRAASGVRDDRSRHRAKAGIDRVGRADDQAADTALPPHRSGSRPHRGTVRRADRDRRLRARPPGGFQPGGQSPSTSITSAVSCAPTTRCPASRTTWLKAVRRSKSRRGRRHAAAPKAPVCLRVIIRRAVLQSSPAP